MACTKLMTGVCRPDVAATLGGGARSRLGVATRRGPKLVATGLKNPAFIPPANPPANPPDLDSISARSNAPSLSTCTHSSFKPSILLINNSMASCRISCISASSDTWIWMVPIKLPGSFGQNRGSDVDRTPWMVFKSSTAASTVPAVWSSTCSNSTAAEFLINGMTDKKIRTAMKMEAIGSNPVQPNHLIKRVEMITPTEPKVSAKMCRKTPILR